MTNRLIPLLALFALLQLSPLLADSRSFDDVRAEVNELMAAEEAPAGVVFEILSWDERTWQWIAPLVTELRGQLRGKFPEIDVVIVSHGADQFQLTREREAEQPDAIAQLASLSDEGVNIHVCGVHSQWNGVPADAYLDFVDVSPSGPAQVNDYVNMGYYKILRRGAD